MPPSPCQLSADELALIDEIENPKPAGLKRQRLIVRGEILRSLVFSLPLDFTLAATHPQTRTVAIAQTGLKIRHCIVLGELNLQDASTADGNALPLLALEDCIFRDKIELCRAHFRALSFAGSRITEICGNNLHLEGNLDLSRVRSSEGMAELARFRNDWRKRTGCEYKKKRFGQAWVELTNARIEGDVKASQACLVAPLARPGFVVRHERARYALELRHSVIRGSLDFNRTVAIGGVAVPRIHMEGHLSGDGARLIGVESSALMMDGAQIGGHIFLRCWYTVDSRFRRFHARGSVELSRARITGVLSMQGAQLKATGNDMALVADHAEISGCFLNGFAHPSTSNSSKTIGYYRLHADGGIYLGYAIVRGDLNLSGSLLLPNENGLAFAGSGITVLGDAMLGQEIADCGRGNRSFPFVATGKVIFDYAVLQQNLDLDGAKLFIRRNLRSGAAFSGEGMRVRGVCRFGTTIGYRNGKPRPLRFWSASQITMISAEIGDTLFMSGAHLQQATDSLDGIALELYGTRIEREANFSPAEWFEDEAVRFESFGSVSLPYLKTGTALVMNGIKIWRQGGKGALFCDYVNIGSFIECRASNGFRVESNGRVSLSYAQAGAFVNFDSADIRLENQQGTPLRIIESKIGGDLDLSGTKITMGAGYFKQVLNLSDSYIAGEMLVNLTVHGQKWDKTDKESRMLDINLTELHIHQLNDRSGRGWGEKTRLLLDGFVCDRLPRRPVTPALPDIPLTPFIDRLPAPWEWPASYISWALALPFYWAVLLFAMPVALLLKFLTPFAGTRPFRQAWSGVASTWDLLGSLRDALLGVSHRAEPHIAWLNRHYEDPKHPTQEEFTPSAYDRLAKSLQEEGYDQESKEVLAAKLTVRRKVSSRWYAWPAWRAYQHLFGYGLSPAKAFATMIALLTFGSISVWVADHDLPWLWNHKHVLVVATSTVSTLAVEEPTGEEKITTAVAYGGKMSGSATSAPVTEEIPCGRRIDPPLYAMELFVPALDLHQTSLCEISYEHSAQWWRVGRAIYAILGWIVTSITVLTVPGILRKRAEE